MIGGIALLGTVSAALASWLSDRLRTDEATTADLGLELAALRQEISLLRTALNQGTAIHANGNESSLPQPLDGP